MPLKHVSMWHKNGWKRISASQADLLFSQSVSAHERMFTCDLCHKHVIFVKGGAHQVSHFKHKKDDPDKECADRTQALTQSEQQILRKTIPNPIRINVESNFFNIEIGFSPIPNAILEKAEALKIQVCISAEDNILTTKNINNNNFSSEETVFHSVGNACFDKYQLQIIPSEQAVYYPLLNREFPGCHSSGTLFDFQTGRKVPIDGDIEIGKQYYLLTKSYINVPRYVSASKLMTDKSYKLYVVFSEEITKETTEFFFNFRCRLTANPTKLIPVWPILHESDHYIETNRQQLFFLLTGDSSLKTEPSHLLGLTNSHALDDKGNTQLISIQNTSRIRMLWAARLSVLRYLSLYYTNSEKVPTNINYETVLLCTDEQDSISNGVHFSLPQKNRLYITTKYDGKVVHRNRSGELRYCSKVKADQTILCERITWGDSIEVYHGMDEVASLTFVRYDINNLVGDEDVYSTLLSCRGRKHPFSHRHKWLLTLFSNMPKSKTYILNAIQKGWIYSDALNTLIYKAKGEIFNGY